MIERKEETTAGQRMGSGCLALFFLPFLGMGLLFAIGPLSGLMEMEGESAGGLVFAALLGLVFAVVGAGGVAAGALGVFGYQFRKNKRPKGKLVEARSHDEHPNFPKAPKKLKMGLRGLRLRPASSAGGKALGLFLFALFWNGIVGFVSVKIYQEEGFGKVFLLVFMGIFILAGLLILGGAIHAFLRWMLVGDTTIEVSKECLAPGERLIVALYQPGDFAITSATVKLVGREQASYGQGTDRVTKKRYFFGEPVVSGTELRASNSGAILEGGIVLPANAMHSFKASNNEVQWLLEVEMDIPGRPDVKDEYPIRVAPLPAVGGTS